MSMIEDLLGKSISLQFFLCQTDTEVPCRLEIQTVFRMLLKQYSEEGTIVACELVVAVEKKYSHASHNRAFSPFSENEMRRRL